MLLWTEKIREKPIGKTIWIEEGKARAMARKARVVLAGTACFLAFLLLWSWSHRAPAAIPVHRVPVQQQSIYRSVTIPGVIETAQSAAIAPVSHATVTAVYVRVGDLVREGDTLCTLQPNDGLGVDSVSLLSLWHTAMQFGGETIVISSNPHALIAPCTGTVLALPETGQVVYQSMPCAAVANLSYLQIRAQVPTTSATDIQAGQTAHITAAEIEAETFAAVVASVTPLLPDQSAPTDPTNPIDPMDPTSPTDPTNPIDPTNKTDETKTQRVSGERSNIASERQSASNKTQNVSDANSDMNQDANRNTSMNANAAGTTATTTEVILPLRGKVDGLRPGYHVTATIATVYHPEAVVVPYAAIRQQDGQSLVFVIQEGKAQARSIEKGYSLGNVCEVTAGLSVGESVIVQPPTTLQAGDVVTGIEEF